MLGQNYPNLEYIVIDDGSSDGSANIIRKYEGRLAYWTTRPNRGQYATINEGFERSTGEIMAWLNSDDMYLPGALSVVGGDFFANIPEVEWLTTTHAGSMERAGTGMLGRETWMDIATRIVSARRQRALLRELTGAAISSRSRRSGGGRCGSGRAGDWTRR